MVAIATRDHPPWDLLVAFALGKLEGDKAILIGSHLAACSDCELAIGQIPDDEFVDVVRSLHVPGRTSLEIPLLQETIPVELRQHQRYEIHERLGAGGMGVVYRARHRLMNRAVAIKLIRDQWLGHAGAVERFRREIQVVAKLSHPNIVTAFDAEEAGKQQLLVMEYVEGMSLDRLVAEHGPLDIARVSRYAEHAARGLEHAHAIGLVHRDIKPSNLIVTKDDSVKILDFGLASIRAAQSNPGLTQPGQGLGTPDFMAPEQIRDAGRIDGRADLYSLGCTLYYLLTGTPPFPEGDNMARLAAHLEREPPSLLSVRPEVPADLSAIVLRLMSKSPDHRYQTAAEVIRALHAPTPGMVRPVRTWRLVALTGAMVGLTMAAIVTFRGGRTEDPAREQTPLPETDSPGVKVAPDDIKSGKSGNKKIESRSSTSDDGKKFVD